MTLFGVTSRQWIKTWYIFRFSLQRIFFFDCMYPVETNHHDAFIISMPVNEDRNNYCKVSHGDITIASANPSREFTQSEKFLDTFRHVSPEQLIWMPYCLWLTDFPCLATNLNTWQYWCEISVISCAARKFSDILMVEERYDTQIQDDVSRNQFNRLRDKANIYFSHLCLSVPLTPDRWSPNVSLKQMAPCYIVRLTFNRENTGPEKFNFTKFAITLKLLPQEYRFTKDLTIVVSNECVESFGSHSNIFYICMSLKCHYLLKFNPWNTHTRGGGWGLVELRDIPAKLVMNSRKFLKFCRVITLCVCLCVCYVCVCGWWERGCWVGGC